MDAALSGGCKARSGSPATLVFATLVFAAGEFQVETQPKITFSGEEPSAMVRQRVEHEVEKLERYFGRITDCNVVFQAPGHHKQQGDLYKVRVHLSLPDGREVIANRNPPKDHAHEDPLVAIRDVFRAARRQLQDNVRKLEGKVKVHDPAPVAVVKSLIAEQDYGFLETVDDREIYFHRNSVLHGGFDKLEVGTRVAFAEEIGNKGPQASTVRILGNQDLKPPEEKG